MFVANKPKSMGVDEWLCTDALSSPDGIAEGSNGVRDTHERYTTTDSSAMFEVANVIETNAVWPPH